MISPRAGFLTSGVVCTAVLLLLACGGDSGTGPDEPDDPGGSSDTVAVARIAIGDTVDVSLTTNDSLRRFSFVGSGAELVIYSQVDAGAIDFRVTDSVSDAVLAYGSASAGDEAGHSFAAHTSPFVAPASRTVLVRVRSYQRVPTRFRLLVLPLQRTPEHTEAQLTIGDTIRTEMFDAGADVDEFHFDATAGDELIGYVQNLSDSLTDIVYMTITRVGDTTQIGRALGHAEDTELESIAPTGPMVMPATGSYLVRLTQSGTAPAGAPPPGVGRYAFQIRRIVRPPEVVSAVLQPGDTLSGESLDYRGDIDEFQVPVVSGRYYAVFAQSGPGMSGSFLSIQVTGQGITEHGVASDPQDSLLSAQTTGPFLVAKTGSLLVRVESGDNGSPLERFAYRLFVYPIDTLPEHAPAELMPGQSADEVLDFPGDMDLFTADAPSTGMLHFQLTNLVSDVVFSQLALADTAEEQCFGAAGGTGTCGFTDRKATAPLHIRIGTFPDETGGFPRPYRFTSTAIDTMPEGAPSTFAIGDTVHSALDPVGDMDTYSFSYPVGEWIRLVTDADGTWTSNSPVYVIRNGSALLKPIDPVTGPFRLPAGGNYTLTVAGASAGTRLAEVGPYWFTLVPASTGTESVSGSLTDGVPVAGERFDFAGDIDEFLFHGTPGVEAEVVLTSQVLLQIEAVSATSDVVLAHGGWGASGRVVIPADGMLRFRVYPYSSILGSYTIVAHQINRAPEVASSALVLGDTVTTEAIDPVGDVDEFSFAGVGGQSVTLTISFPAAFDLVRGVAELVDPSTQQVLGAVTGHDGMPDHSAPITLPATKTYTVRVRGEHDTEGYGAYRLVVE
jgi:hypothetical protein